MDPILFIHGYSAESSGTDPTSIKGIYGNGTTNTNLPDDLRSAYKVIELDLSRYISLNDSVTINDISRALDGALRRDYPNLLASGFNVITHSTGALVISAGCSRLPPCSKVAATRICSVAGGATCTVCLLWFRME